MSNTNDPKHNSEEHRTEPPQEQTPGNEQSKAPTTKRTPQDWDTLVNQRIEEAMRNGAFDNLRNKGKPLDAAPDPHVPPDMQMANSLLKNNDLAPAWISDRGATLAAIERFREKLRTIAADFAQARAEAATPQRGQQLDQMWQAYVESWRAEVVELNKRILTQNLKQPVSFLEIVPLRLEDELKRVM
ncbi:MAG: DnaJ family domain-containing protein [Caldilineaceae bacterium]